MPCTPDSTWQVLFSNPLSAQAFQDSQLRIEPLLSGMKPFISGKHFEHQRFEDARHHLSRHDRQNPHDQFEQTLGEDQAIEFKTGALSSLIGLSAEGLVVFDPAAPRRLSLYSINYQR